MACARCDTPNEAAAPTSGRGEQRRGSLVAYHHTVLGEGAPVVLIHGVGPGTTGAANFGPLLADLALTNTVHIIDLIGFGTSNRKSAAPFFDVALWVAQVEDVLDGLSGPAALIGNSVGGAVALKVASRRTDVASVLAIGAPVAAFTPAPALRQFWSVPASAAELAASMRLATGAQTETDPAQVAARYAAFDDPAYRSYFASMVEDPWRCLQDCALTSHEVAAIAAPVILAYGRRDRLCPPSAIVPSLLDLLPDADVVLVGGCGHHMISERTGRVLSLIRQANENAVTRAVRS